MLKKMKNHFEEDAGLEEERSKLEEGEEKEEDKNGKVDLKQAVYLHLTFSTFSRKLFILTIVTSSFRSASL